ncbi:response regulator transcription factor [Nocardioides sp. zg-536]|uniref:Response regulator transcription factor n=1 Tax=Nocardioides faecalis TaxID=2803858 RepID=A0A938XYL0_9ACTN|nr:response regulator transcription factor [Nocardioides faecalis]MBM9458566.1 response regulator transcription factor [Nocardioides faecalis]MBS4752897.1 response regulator transcription factor [Nocardioides faecalis]QVI58568.1 response regulator transcription factor [Nocardioides faecalis]
MSTSRPSSQITIIDDHALFAESLALTFETEGYPVRRIDLTRPGTTLATVLAATLRSSPRVVILDLDLGALGDGGRLIQPLAAAGTSVLVITGSNDQGRWGRCLDAGAKHVMLKSRPLHEVVAVVRRARDGLPLMPPADRLSLIELARRDHSEVRDIRNRLERLTQREMEILGMLMNGSQVREIARTGVVSEATVRTQVKAILAKLETNSQLAAVGAAFKAGWRPPSA